MRPTDPYSRFAHFGWSERTWWHCRVSRTVFRVFDESRQRRCLRFGLSGSLKGPTQRMLSIGSPLCGLPTASLPSLRARMSRFAEASVVDVAGAGGTASADVVRRSRGSVCPSLSRNGTGVTVVTVPIARTRTPT